MSADNEAESKPKRLRLDNDTADFVYTGQENVPRGVICVRVHLSVKVIRARAFFRQSLLMSVELHDGIEVIEEEAFEECRSLREMLFLPSVRAIKYWAFRHCSGLRTAILNDGLEVIEVRRDRPRVPRRRHRARDVAAPVRCQHRAVVRQARPTTTAGEPVDRDDHDDPRRLCHEATGHQRGGGNGGSRRGRGEFAVHIRRRGGGRRGRGCGGGRVLLGDGSSVYLFYKI